MSTPATFPRFSEAEYRRREVTVQSEMAARGLDALIIVGDSGSRTANHANIYWLTNYIDPGPAYVIMTAIAGPILLISNPLYLHTARRAGRAKETEAFIYGRNPGELLAVNAESVLRVCATLRLQYMGATSMVEPEIDFPGNTRPTDGSSAATCCSRRSVRAKACMPDRSTVHSRSGPSPRPSISVSSMWRPRPITVWSMR